MTSVTAQDKDLEALSLENCDKEPVHIPGHIQSFAGLIATDENLNLITHCSENIEEIFGRAAEDIIGARLSEVIDSEIIHNLNNTLSLSSIRRQRERVCDFVKDDKTFEVWAHISGTIPVIEFEKVQAEHPGTASAMIDVRSLLGYISQNDNLEKYLSDAVSGLRTITGFDRVMAYQFDTNGHGTIKAESKAPDLGSFLGLQFPSWDIPKQARAILLKLPLRVIADVNAAPRALVKLAPDTPPLDMTLAACRGTSPIHMEYLRNMGVGATMTLSIVVGGELWGLFAFHHMQAKHIGPTVRAASELFAAFFSLQMEQRLEKERNKARTQAIQYQTALMEAADSASNITELIDDIAKPFCQFVSANGLAILSEESISRHGDTPPAQDIRQIAKALFLERESDLAMTDSLKALGFESDICSGALAVKLVHNDEQGRALIFFRRVADVSVQWAGAPQKQIADDGDVPRLLPRKSFESYTQSMKDKSYPWERRDIVAAQEAARAIAKADTAMFRRLSHKEERLRSLYIAELNHRVRNILALIRSLSRRAHESSNSLESYARALEQRIAALGAAHDLAANKVTSGVPIHEVFETEIKPYAGSLQDQLFITGKPYALKADVAPIFALIAHELVTNCVKYGALSSSTGQVHIQIIAETDGITILWEEKGGPLTQKPNKHGFGLGLIEKAIPYELDGDSEITFAPEGLKAKFWLPEKTVDLMPDDFQLSQGQNSKTKSRNNPLPETVLVVEDSMMVALDMSEMLRSLGIDHIQTSASVAQAKRSLKTTSPDFAILDISLRTELSFEIAQILETKNIPFCFATGYGSNFELPDSLSNHIVLTKPVDLTVLKSTIAALFIKD